MQSDSCPFSLCDARFSVLVVFSPLCGPRTTYATFISSLDPSNALHYLGVFVVNLVPSPGAQNELLRLTNSPSTQSLFGAFFPSCTANLLFSYSTSISVWRTGHDICIRTSFFGSFRLTDSARPKCCSLQSLRGGTFHAVSRIHGHR